LRSTKASKWLEPLLAVSLAGAAASLLAVVEETP